MAVTITDLRNGGTIFNEADATTGLTGTLTVYTSAPTPVEATGSLGAVVSTATNNYYYTTGTGIDLSDSLIYIFVRPYGTMDNLAAGGVGIVIGDGTNRMAYYVGGSDQAGFRHSEGPIEWTCFIIDTASLPTGKATISGSEGSMSWTAITDIGIRFKTLAKALGNVENCFIDIIRVGHEGLRITGGGSGTEGNFDEIATGDRAITNQQAFGVCRELASGVFGLQGPLTFGDNTSLAVDFDSTGETVAFEPPPAGVAVDRFWLKVEGNATGTCSVVWNGCTFICPVGVGAELIAIDADVDTLDIDGCVFKGFEQGVSFLTATTSNTFSVTNSTFDGCGEIDLGFLLQDGTFTNNIIKNSTNSANGALTLSSTGYASGNDLTDTTFISGGTGHAIYITQAGTYDFTDLVFSGYGADATTNAAVYNNSGGAVTINASGCTGLTVRNGTSATTTVITDPVTTTVTVRDINTKALLEDARVLLVASDGTGGLPFEESVTISRSGSTATVAHTAHGMATGDFALIDGADQQEYNGCFEITVTGVNAYTYTVAGTPTTPATGTIISTGGIFNTLTSASGIVTDSRSISVDQPVVGRVRLSTSPDYYKSAPISGTVDAESGWAITVQLIPDA